MNALARPDTDAVASLRQRLADGGWRPVAVYSHDAPVPAKSRGKAPRGDDWTLRARRDPPAAVVEPVELCAMNTGLLCDGLRVVDGDIDDPHVAAQVRALAIAMLGDSIIRTRENAPRFLLPYRAASGSPPKRAQTGRLGKVEILGHGQQFVSHGLHQSGVPQHWFPEAPENIPVESLPAVTEAQVDAFLAAVAPLIEADSAMPKAGIDTPHLPSAFGPSADALDVAAALAAIPNDAPSDWEYWNRVGMASYAASGGGAAGFAAWCAWSQRHPTHDDAACRERWEHYATSPPNGDIGAGTLFHMARQARPGWHKPTDAPSASDNGCRQEAPDPELLAHPDMSVLRLHRRPPPPLPVAVFGDRWARWIGAVAESAACPPDYVAGTLLAAASALIGNARWAQATPGWAEPPHLWCAAVGDSGTGKSPGADALMRHVLPAIERNMLGDFPDRQRDWRMAKEKHDAAHEQWKADVRTATKSGNAPPLPPDGQPPAEPQPPRLRQHDVTIEKVATLLATAAPKGLLIVRDELAGWLTGMTAYNDAGRQFWIESYGGRPFRVERQKHPEPIDVPRLVVAVTGSTQPERLAELMREADDGLLARFCWFWPDALPFRLARTAPGTDWATTTLDRLRLLDLTPGAPGEPASPRMVPLAEAALPDLEAFGRDMQDRQHFAAGLMRSALGKARGLALRLALVLEHLWWCARDGYEAPPAGISHAAFTSAAHLVADYAMPMAERVYGDAACPEADRNAATLARWIMQAKPNEVHVRKLLREVRLPGLQDAEAVKSAAAVLVDAGWLLPPAPGTFQQRGRTAYPVNPRVFEALP